MERDYIGHIYQIRYGVVGETLRWNFSLGKHYKSDIYVSLLMEISYLKMESAGVQSLAR